MNCSSINYRRLNYIGNNIIKQMLLLKAKE
jgi:hypothetical protein